MLLPGTGWGLAEDCLSAPILNIDHHVSNTQYADYLLLDDRAAATGEIMYRMLEANRIPVDQELATDLYTAIVTDCGFSSTPTPPPGACGWAADLVALGVKPDEISDQLELKARNSVELLAKVLPSLSFYAGGKIATLEVLFPCMTRPFPRKASSTIPGTLPGWTWRCSSSRWNPDPPG